MSRILPPVFYGTVGKDRSFGPVQPVYCVNREFGNRAGFTGHVSILRAGGFSPHTSDIIPQIFPPCARTFNVHSFFTIFSRPTVRGFSNNKRIIDIPVPGWYHKSAPAGRLFSEGETIMEVKIGEKLRELRKRDGRTQEEVAAALGVSNQAVSKWESMNGYPDLETIPALANYFGVTIDSLFGYEGEREARIRAVCDEADAHLNRQGDQSECLALLRRAAQEFPANPDILVRLGYALHMQGWKVYGGRSYTDADHPNATPDTAYNLRNEYWEEAKAVFERVLGMELKTADRETVIPILLNIYSERGETDEAEKLALTMPSLRNGREALLSMVWDDKVEQHNGECLLTLLDLLHSHLIGATAGRTDIPESETARLLRAVIKLYEDLIPDGNFLYCHAQLSELYTFLAHSQRLDARLNDNPDCEDAMESVRKALDHEEAFRAALGRGKVRFTAPLFSEVEWDSGSEPAEPDHDSVVFNLTDMTQGLDPEFVRQIEEETQKRKE